MKDKIFEILDDLEISYSNYEHEAVFTCEQAMSVKLPGIRVKSLLLYNEKKTKYFMVVIEDFKRLDGKKLQKTLNEKKLNFVKEEYMLQKIGIGPGHVSPFALINNTENDIYVIFDESIRGTTLGFHPGRNDNTVIINLGDIEKYLEKINNNFTYLEL